MSILRQFLRRSETIIIGKIDRRTGSTSCEENSERIRFLISDKLEECCSILGAVLYRDPVDERSWELQPYYPKMDGPVFIHCVPPEKVKAKFLAGSDEKRLKEFGRIIFVRNQKLLSGDFAVEDFPILSFETAVLTLASNKKIQQRLIERIYWLKTVYLRLVKETVDGSIFQDPNDGIYWESLTSGVFNSSGRNSETEEDSFEILHCVDANSARIKYKLMATV